MISKFVEVILPLPLKGTFTYFTNQNIDIGQRVIVQFGVRKLYSAVVKKVHSKQPKEYTAKPILAILDEPPIVNTLQLKLWDWISKYYMCELGDIMNIALPSSLKLASESKILIHPNFDGDISPLDSEEANIINTLVNNKESNIYNLSSFVKNKNILSVINQMIRKELVFIQEDLQNKFYYKKVSVLSFITTKNKLADIKLTKKQLAFIESYFILHNREPQRKWIVSEMLKEIGFSRSILNLLIKKDIFAINQEIVSRLSNDDISLTGDKKLCDFQKNALSELKKGFIKKDVCLLHGVTSSGKTELYIKLIKEQIEKGKQVLFLMPEIALTMQMVTRLKQVFGNKVGLSHSHLNNSERVEVWNCVQYNNHEMNYPIILGARSSLFLPFNNLGLVIVDEEHDTSYKQHHISPRYHARDVAIYLASLHKAKVILGSATPSLESYYNVNQDKFYLVEMSQRYKGISLPKIEIIDIRKAHLKKQMTSQFSNIMIDMIKSSLILGKQIILFQNRRGYSPVMSCCSCSFTPVCKQCDVSLTYHKIHAHLRCHYCGYTEKLPNHCPSCFSEEFQEKGFGTEQVEEKLNELFPNYIITRMDYDTTRKKNSYQHMISDFEQGKIDILIGTQMVTKGLDFDNVALVGILDADSMLSFPDFRAYERAFSLMIQVAGRAGRKSSQGKVLIQTYNPDHKIFQLLKDYNLSNFTTQQISERKLFNYPPFYRLIGITLKHKNKSMLNQCAEQLSLNLKNSFGSRVLGPEFPFIARIRNYYNKHILLKIEREMSFSNAKKIINMILNNLKERKDFRSLRIVIDVDPY